MRSGEAGQTLDGSGFPLGASVVICAYTELRWADLARSVRLLANGSDEVGGEVAPAEVIVVVDNNEQLLERVRRELPNALAVANDGPPGLSGARNVGVAKSSGDVVVFLDDDAVPQPGWLGGLLAHYDNPSVMGVGGGADALWPGERPRWFPAEFEWVVGCSWRGLPTEAAPVRNMIGCNMSFRREVFDLAGGFLHEIGRVGTRPLGCEETELCIRLRQRKPDTVLIYDPTVRVTHRVSQDRIRWRYFRSRCFAEGISKALVTDQVGSRDGLSAERAHTLKVLPAGVSAGLRAGSGGDRGGWLRAGSIVAGLAATTAGYGRGRVSTAWASWRLRNGAAECRD